MLTREPHFEWQIRTNLVGGSRAFVEALSLISRVAKCDAPVLMIGETGTGKELAARATHYVSARHSGPFVPVNCGAIPDTLVESEMFGHARGAFSGASQARRGLARQAEGGTLFLDEVETLSARAQAVLLRFLQDNSFRPVGEDVVARANVRIVAAANADLNELVDKGEFRKDLLFRLAVLTVKLPALRDRRDDIAPLADHLLQKAARTTSSTKKELLPDALDLLRGYDWPGNVRELEHLMLRAQLLAQGPAIQRSDLVAASSALLKHAEPRPRRATLREAKQRAIAEVERHFVEKVLSEARGNISEAARRCNMDRASVSKLAKKYRLGAGTQAPTPPTGLSRQS